MATTRTILALETNATTLAHFLPFEIVVLHTFNARSERQSAKNTCGTCILWHGCHHKITHTEVLVVHTEDMRISYTIFAENPKQKISLNLEADGRIIFNGSQDIEWTSIMGSFASKQPYSMHAGNKKKSQRRCYKRNTFQINTVLSTDLMSTEWTTSYMTISMSK
jgi:hypothetical protein